MGAAPRRSVRPRTIIMLSAVGGLILLAWIATLAFTLPGRYEARNWNVAWAGFDVMILVSLLATGWTLASRPSRAVTPLTVTAALLVCDAWFDATTASPGDAATSLVFALALELPLAAVMAGAARWLSVRRAPQPARVGIPSR